jgi:hypothetical protein
MGLALLCAGTLVYRRFGGFIAPLTVIRVGLSGAVGWLTASYVPHDSRIMAIVALGAGFFAFLAALVVLREANAADLAVVRRIVGRGKR